MPRHPQLYAWAATVATRFPDLPRPTAFALAAWSLGLVLAHACGLTAVVAHLAPLLGRSANTTRQRLREFYLPAGRKRGPTGRPSTRPPAAAPSSGGSPPGGPTSGSP